MNCLKYLLIPATSLAFFTACEQSAATGASSAPQSDIAAVEASSGIPGPQNALPALFDCVREEGGLLLAAHRGGPVPGYPENALETLENTLSSAAFVMEIDVAETRDGVLVLMHDDTLDRTTTGSGPVSDMDWEEIAKLDLVDNEGQVTDFAVPTLHEALSWAVRNDAILELDRKKTTSFESLIETVRNAGAESHVILITYTDAQALDVAELAPDLMMTAGIGGPAHQARMISDGLDPENLIAWTGTDRPNPGKWKGLASSGIESAFGTLGRPGERLDDVYWEDGNPSEYSQLARDGLTMLSTDEVHRLARADGWIATAQDIARKECMRDF